MNHIPKDDHCHYRLVPTGYGQNGDKPERQHAKTATDCPDQNSDKLKWRQVKTATVTVWHGSYMHWTCVLGRRPHSVAWQCVHCCNGDAASQWEMAILGCQNSITLNQFTKNLTCDYVDELTSNAKFHKIRWHKG